MTDSNALHLWLQEAETQGEFESEGSFTLDRRKAWEKLGAYQLPFEDDWALKLVQAAVVDTEVDELNISQSNEDSSFVFRCSSPWSAEWLKDAFYKVDTRLEAGAEHLLIAVRSLALKRRTPFFLLFPNGDSLAWNGEEFQHLESSESSGTFTVLVTHYEFGASRSYFSADNRTAADTKERIARHLRSHCHFAPANILLEGRPIANHLCDPVFGATESSENLALSKLSPHPELPNIEVLTCSRAGSAQIGGINVTADSSLYAELIENDALTECSAAVLLSVFWREEIARRTLKLDKIITNHHQASSELIWLKDGVVLDRESITSPQSLGVGILLSAEGLPTDLTGFRLLDNENRRSRRRWAMMAVSSFLEFSNPDKRCPVRLKSRKIGTVVKGVLGLGLVLATPVIGGLMLGGAGYDYKISQERETSLNEALKTAYDQMIFELRGKAK